MTTFRIILALFFLQITLPVWGVSNLKVFHRSGQTFLTWQEDRGRTGESYKIYRSSTPFAASSDLTAKRFVATLPEDTSLYYTDIFRGVQPSETYQPLARYVIEDLGPQLPAGRGLFVYTPKAEGQFYYSITQVVGGTEDKRIQHGTTKGPIAETLALPRPVLVWKSANNLNRIYTHWMDFHNWNPTYDAPRELNEYYGFNPSAPSIRRAVQYAYSFLVTIPRGYNPKGGKTFPLALHLHGHKLRYGARGGPDQFGWRVIELMPDDPNCSWFFGFGVNHDFRSNLAPSGGTIVNFTEMRVLQNIDQILTNPFYKIDPDRIYVHGHSMGGSGALAFGMRYPNVFAQIYAGQPYTNYRSSPSYRVRELEGKWGRIGANLKIQNRGPYALPLEKYNGTPVWEWQNHQQQLLRRKSDEMSYIMVDHGSLDKIIPFDTQGRDFYYFLTITNRAFSGEVTNADHVWQGFVARNYNGFSLGSGIFPPRQEALVAFSRATQSSGFPTPPIASFNKTLRWAGKSRMFARGIIDLLDQFVVNLKSDGGTQTVDVTPRRVQNFKIQKGASYQWKNQFLTNNGVIQQGRVVATTNTILTLPRVTILSAGNRLTITRIP